MHETWTCDDWRKIRDLSILSINEGGSGQCSKFSCMQKNVGWGVMATVYYSATIHLCTVYKHSKREVKDEMNENVTPPEKRQFLLKLVASSSKGILLSSSE